MNVKHRLQVCPSLSAAANVVIVNGPLVCPEDEGGQWRPAGGGCVVGVLQQPPHGDVLVQTCEYTGSHSYYNSFFSSYCEAQGKGRAKGRPRKVTQRSFIDGGWWISFP